MSQANPRLLDRMREVYATGDFELIERTALEFWTDEGRPHREGAASDRVVMRAAGRNPENIYLARRAAVLSVLATSGAPPERAEMIVRQWEARAEAAGIPRLDRLFWDGAVVWTSGRAWPHGSRSRA